MAVTNQVAERPSSKDPVGDRMKGLYEAATRIVLPARTHTVLRLDGRAFHSYTKGLARPFDCQLMEDMDAVAAALCAEISGSALAYTQSDEISVVLTDYGTERTQPWFGGVVQKMVSVAAALATAVLNARRADQVGKLATFDCRAFTIDDRDELVAYLNWRRADCVRNSVAMAAQARFSAKSLHGASVEACKARLRDAGAPWEDLPEGFRFGRILRKETRVETITYTHKRTGEEMTVTAPRSRWEARPAATFTRELIDGLLPAAPQ